jgi:hypothetical protein
MQLAAAAGHRRSRPLLVLKKLLLFNMWGLFELLVRDSVGLAPAVVDSLLRDVLRPRFLFPAHHLTQGAISSCSSAHCLAHGLLACSSYQLAQVVGLECSHDALVE